MHRKQTFWTNHPVLQFCAHVTNVHALVLEFLLSVSYDHSILLDFIVSPETCKFDRFLVEYFEVCVSSWSDLTASCQAMDPYSKSTSWVHTYRIAGYFRGMYISRIAISILVHEN